MTHDQDIQYLKMAIANSQRSLDAGLFPAGAVIVQDGQILASEGNAATPQILHADSIALTKAYQKTGNLKGATLYIGLESCLMCTGVAYWSGIRRIVYAIPKAKVSRDYYETPLATHDLIDSFNESIERVHIPELEDEALHIVQAWEKKYL